MQIDFQAFIIIILVVSSLLFLNSIKTKNSRRKSYYRNVYLKSDKWKKQRNRVFRRDNWKCVYCPNKAEQVHHKRYAKKFGNEPDHWLVSVCKLCHKKLHHK